MNDIYRSYEVSRESLKVTKENARQNFDVKVYNEAEKLIETSEKHIEDFYVVFLWAVFERHIIQYIIKKGDKFKELRPDSLASEIYGKYKREVKYWRFNDTLDLLTKIIDKNTIDDAKKIKRYRDWVVHRSESKTPSGSVTPIAALHILSAIISALDKN
ncbi:MAG: hypothetical protein HQL06_02610 [Nitrospirae bacterium]|nr:hypothetical protein [Nitrospirota bacterium]